MSTNRLGRGLGALFQEHDIESLESFEQVKEGEVIHQLEEIGRASCRERV